MSWLHCFWGVGTIVSPYVMSYALIHSGWQTGYRTVSLIQLCIFIVLLFALPLWKINSGSESGEPSESAKPLGVMGALKIPGVPYLLIGFLAYCAAESTTMLWASSYLEEAMSLSKDEAAALGSLFFIGMTVGRFLAGFITERLGDGKMIRLGTVIALIGVGLITVQVNLLAIVGFILIGLGCAPIYPSIIHSTPSNFGEKNSAAIIGIQMASAYTGSLLAPPLFGIIAEGTSLRIMPIYLLAFFILMIVMIRKTERAVK